MNKEFIPYEQALALKELGFDEPCVYYVDKDNKSYIYNFETHPDEFIEGCGVNVIPTPTFSQAFRWFREKYGYSHSITQHEIIEGQTDLLYIDESEEFQDIGWLARVEPDFIKIFKTYEEAELACLIKLIEIVKL